uniref:B30.2/SPRY domain-containing protein n=1 Tax=Anopheles minimus TaxID=112268 RepID=A0A182WK31_9DIPT
MTKSPSPQRLTSEAPCLASVQEEEPEPVVEAAEQRLATVEPILEPTQLTTDDNASMAPVVEAHSAAPSHQEPVEQPALLEPTPATVVSPAMEVEESEPLALAEADEKSEAVEEEEDVSLPTTETTDKLEAEKLSTQSGSEHDSKVDDEQAKAEEPTNESDPKPASASTTTGEAESSDKSKAGTTKPEKKPNAQQQAQNNLVEFVTEEIEPQLSAEAENTFTLSWYDSDLNLTIDDKDLLSAKPLSDGIFGLVWAGVRASRGVTGGKVFYEVLVVDELQPATKSPLVPEGETPTPEIRIGWSTLAEGKRQLGETDLSYGYSNCGNKVSGGTFEQYGVAYGKNDVVGAYLDMESSPCQMQFTVNRVRQGPAFEFEKETLNDKALFPHVYAKNLSFKVNFGTVEDGFHLTEKKPVSTDKATTETGDKDAKQTTEPTAAKEEGKEEGDTVAKEESTSDDTAKEEEGVKMEETEPATTASEEEAAAAEKVPFDGEFKFLNCFVKENEACVVDGLKGPLTRDCCELVMMVGLPGSGKTTWVQNYLKENPDTSFTLLSIDSLLENMKVLGKAREPSNTPQWQKVVEQLSRNMARLIEIACKRRRHILIDQTNVFASEQKRRLKGFGGFKTRRAVAVVPNLEEYNRRYELKVAKYGKEVPETTLNTMKANIFVPSLVQNWYTEIVFTELAETEAQETIKKMNEEGRKLLPPRRNRANQSNRQKHNNNANSNYTSRWNHNNRPQGGGQQYGKNRYVLVSIITVLGITVVEMDTAVETIIIIVEEEATVPVEIGTIRGIVTVVVEEEDTTTIADIPTVVIISSSRIIPIIDTMHVVAIVGSNLNNLLAPNGSNADGSAGAAASSSSHQWAQYGNNAHQSSSYGNYNNSKGSGSGGASSMG